MDDASLIAFLNLSDAEAAIIIPRLKPIERAFYDRMADVCATASDNPPHAPAPEEADNASA